MLAERKASVTLLVECAGDGGPEPRTLDKMADEAAIDFSPSFPFVAKALRFEAVELPEAEG